MYYKYYKELFPVFSLWHSYITVAFSKLSHVYMKRQFLHELVFSSKGWD